MEVCGEITDEVPGDSCEVPAVLLMSSSYVVENGGGTTAVEAGRWVVFVTGGRNVTGAVAARMLIKPGVKGRAVLLRTLLTGSSGNGVSAG